MQHNKPFLTRIATLCLVSFSSTFSPAIAFDNVDPADTAYYYNEHGTLLWRDGTSTKTINYVIRTKKQPNEVFQELAPTGDSVKVSSDYAPAQVLNISRRTARRVERLIRKGQINDPLVIANVVSFHERSMLRRMYDNILIYCKDYSQSGFREMGGVLLPDGTLTCVTGDITDPRTFVGASLYVKQKGLVYYHSHPYGKIENTSHASYASTSRMNGNKVNFSEPVQTQTLSYIQGPSKQDQDVIGMGTGYVFGMSEDVAMIYIYDKDGVKATLPMSFVKKFKKPAMREARKVETYTASLSASIPLPRFF
jgi:hypothetical protein